MRGYFDDEEAEPERPRRDTELTLGSGAVLASFLALVLICGLCFGLGYAVGHHASAALRGGTPRIPPLPIRSRCRATAPFPSLRPSAQAPVPPPGDDKCRADCAGAGRESGSDSTQSPGAAGRAIADGAPQRSSPTPVRPALPAAQHVAAGAAPSVRPALPRGSADGADCRGGEP